VRGGPAAGEAQAVVERSDRHISGRLIERTRLLIAISDEVPVEVKLQTQGLLKLLERELDADEPEQDAGRIRACYGSLYDQLNPYADLEALLSALKTFVHCLR
jgi:hypothetical protein